MERELIGYVAGLLMLEKLVLFLVTGLHGLSDLMVFCLMGAGVDMLAVIIAGSSRARGGDK